MHRPEPVRDPRNDRRAGLNVEYWFGEPRPQGHADEKTPGRTAGGRGLREGKA